jgi:hypothetical protein
MSEGKVLCELCGEPMPPDESMFKVHGYSGDCPKPPLPNPVEDNYVAWCRYTGRSIVTCDSDSDGAFRVYRHADSADRLELQYRINFLEQNETVVWEALRIADGSTIHDVYTAIAKLRTTLAARESELAEAQRRVAELEAKDKREQIDDLFARRDACSSLLRQRAMSSCSRDYDMEERLEQIEKELAALLPPDRITHIPKEDDDGEMH